MRKVTFTIATGQVDSHGDIFTPGCFGERGSATLIKGFSMKAEDYLGTAETKTEGDALVAEADIPEWCLDLYPAVGFKTLQCREEGGVRVIEKATLICVGLCVAPNADPNIKTIREQLGEK